ncbi:MAG: XdhC family protein [Syntrophaceae bacterium]|nr:XdhC family protein [Deltaproteobacteria bacterium]
MKFQDNMYGKALEWVKEGREVALATVISTWGSSPRPVGSQLVIDGQGNFEGSVSGGCIEGAVITEAREVMRDGKPRRLVFGVSQDKAWEVGLTCGGEIEIFVEKAPSRQMLEDLASLEMANRGVCLATDLETGEKTLIPLDEGTGVLTLPEGFREAAGKNRETDRNFSLDKEGHRYFFHGVHPAPELIIFGAVHIAQPLAHIARFAGYDVVVVDPREAFANKGRFPDVPLIVEWPDVALKGRLHTKTALVTMTHDPKLDDPALVEGLKSDAFYIGALGSRKTHAARLERLCAAGFPPESLARIHGPVGLSIGALSQEEIAIAIMAQITQRRRLGG